MIKEDLKNGMMVRNIKHNVIETIIDINAKQRMEDGTWVDSVIYEGTDRFTGKKMMFSRELNSFVKDFESVDYTMSNADRQNEYSRSIGCAISLIGIIIVLTILIIIT